MKNEDVKDLIIIGCQRSGKTTLTKMITSATDIYNVVSLDSLTIAMRKNMKEFGIEDESTLVEISRRMVPFLSTYLKLYKADYPEKKYLIEGIQINPEDLCKYPFFNNADIVCLGFPNANVDDIFANIRREDKKLENSYTAQFTDEKLMEMVARYIKYSRFLQRQCKKFNIPFYETDKDREKTLHFVLDKVFQNSKSNNDMER